MSINKEILYNMLESYIREKYHDNDIEWWLWLIKKIVMHRPEKKCVIRGGEMLFKKLDDNKTLFKTNGRGLAIGNLTSQIFANFYLSKFDHWLLEQINKEDRYGRYVDDFVIISRDKKMLLKLLPKIREWLANNLQVTLHPHKVYLQHVTKGVSFIGSVIKPNRIYCGNRTIANMDKMVNKWNHDNSPNTERYVCRYNSYQGFLIHSNTYGIRRKMYNKIKNKGNIVLVGDCHHIKYVK